MTNRAYEWVAEGEREARAARRRLWWAGVRFRVVAFLWSVTR